MSLPPNVDSEDPASIVSLLEVSLPDDVSDDSLPPDVSSDVEPTDTETSNSILFAAVSVFDTGVYNDSDDECSQVAVRQKWGDAMHEHLAEFF